MQSVKGSLAESTTNVIAGFGLNWLLNMIGFHAMGFAVSGSSVLVMSIVMTAVSFIRSYAIRRSFNRLV